MSEDSISPEIDLSWLGPSFIAKMAHKLRTPLNAIIGFSDLLLLGESGPLNDEQYEQISGIRVQGQVLLGLLNDLLKLAELELDPIPLRAEEFQLDEILEGLSHSLRAQAQQARSTISLVRPETPMRVTTDSRSLKLLLSMLLQYLFERSKYPGEYRISFGASGRASHAYDTKTCGCSQNSSWICVSISRPGQPDATRELLEQYHHKLTLPTKELMPEDLKLLLVRQKLARLGGTLTIRQDSQRVGHVCMEWPQSNHEENR